jgi:hypothetical protein
LACVFFSAQPKPGLPRHGRSTDGCRLARGLALDSEYRLAHGRRDRRSLMSASIAAMGWRSSFLALGVWVALGSVVVYWYRDDPGQKAGVSNAELK